ncbi:UPF0711 protein C18orf21 homolog [Gouania willdenowi]|uniref:Uncharacterized protein n=1 Tax=Gouania willdenowi TaxID=441366 RepID=A0A8C5HD28_GOUWI|nr:UPF0711 protein C18orf21 homolog [Gouania willdenowi]
MQANVPEKRANFLMDASVLYKDKCPEMSRFLLQSTFQENAFLEERFSILQQNMLVCPFCRQWLQPDNHRIRVWPKKRPSARVQSVLLRKARGKRLSLMQKNLLHRFQRSSSLLMATCHTCIKTSRHKGMNRDFIASLAKTHSTPGSSSKHKTPQSANRSVNRSVSTTPKTPCKTKTTVHTPRSTSNTTGSGSSSSKPSSKNKNWVVQRLSKILMREDEQSSKKGGLKDFLSSL